MKGELRGVGVRPAGAGEQEGQIETEERQVGAVEKQKQKDRVGGTPGEVY